MKEIVIISGKGGTGKTSITAALSYLGGNAVVTADCDVDAADMHILTQPDRAITEDFYSGELAHIDQDFCIQCSKCYDVCRFDAVSFKDGIFDIVDLNCEGCGYCARVCPTQAIEMKPQNVGEWYISTTRFNTKLVHARLGFGAENSGKLVTKVKEEAQKLAKQNKADWLLVDGSPGIGCPVVASLSGANFVLLVTEPSVSGLHDLKRVYELVKKFRIPAGCIINKSDINSEINLKIKDFLKSEGVKHIQDIPYNEDFTKAMTLGQNIVEYESQALKPLLEKSWKKIMTMDN